MQRQFTTPDVHNDSNSEAARSAKEILMELDPTFVRAVGILNKYHPTEDSSTYNPDDLNQNKAIGTDSEMNSLSRGNTGSEARTTKNPINSEERGGSSMSDLHNTEYVDDSKDPKPKMSPHVKNISAKYTRSSGSNRTTSGRAADVPVNKVIGGTKPKVDNSAAEATDGSGSSHSTSRSGSRGSRGSRSSSRTGTSDSERTRESESEGESESDTSMNTFDFKVPDPSADRDLDNASPKTLDLCQRYPCHYCFFIYFPSATVDEDLMPFRRKAFTDKVARLQNSDHIREVKQTRCARDAFADRRIKCIERKSNTQIRLSDLSPSVSFVKGLPRRRLTIAGSSFAEVSCALNLFRDLLPRVLKNSVFPYRLPEGVSTRFASGSRNSTTHQWGTSRSDGAVSLRAQLDDKGGWRSFLVPNKI